MQDWLNRPFIIVETLIEKIGFSFFTALFIFLFLFVFQPFGIILIDANKINYILGFSIITFFSLLIISLITPLILKQTFDPDTWTIRKTLIFFFFVVSAIAILNWGYSSLMWKEVLPQRSFLTFFFYTVAVGFSPLALYILFAEKILTHWRKRETMKLTQELSLSEKKIEGMLDLGFAQRDRLRMSINNLMCIKAEGNYVDVYYVQDEVIQKKLIRSSLVQIEKQLTPLKYVIRCHRSYLINLQNVNRVTGNARNYMLHIENLPFHIPVSRKCSKIVVEKIKTIL